MVVMAWLHGDHTIHESHWLAQGGGTGRRGGGKGEEWPIISYCSSFFSLLSLLPRVLSVLFLSSIFSLPSSFFLFPPPPRFFSTINLTPATPSRASLPFPFPFPFPFPPSKSSSHHITSHHLTSSRSPKMQNAYARRYGEESPFSLG